MLERHDDYIDPKFEFPWIQSGTGLEENIQLEKTRNRQSPEDNRELRRPNGEGAKTLESRI